MTDYPLPSHAAYIWIAGDRIFLGLPPFRGDHGHTVQFPNTERGLTVALTTLRARSASKEPTVGTAAAPIQHDIDTLLKKVAKQREVDREGADDLLKEVGL